MPRLIPVDTRMCHIIVACPWNSQGVIFLLPDDDARERGEAGLVAMASETDLAQGIKESVVRRR
jgi:hypothetical protein